MIFVMGTTAIPTRQPWGKAGIQWWHARVVIRCYGWTFATDLQGTLGFDSCCAGDGYVDTGTPGTVSHLLSFPCAPSVFPGALFPLPLLFFSPLRALTLFLTSQVSTYLTTNIVLTLWMKFQVQNSLSQCTAETLWLWTRKLSWARQALW